MLERTKRYKGKDRGRDKRNSEKQGRRVEKGREDNVLERISIHARFCYPSRTDNPKPS